MHYRQPAVGHIARVGSAFDVDALPGLTLSANATPLAKASSSFPSSSYGSRFRRAADPVVGNATLPATNRGFRAVCRTATPGRSRVVRRPRCAQRSATRWRTGRRSSSGSAPCQARVGKVSPNIGSPLLDSSAVTSSCRTSRCSASRFQCQAHRVTRNLSPSRPISAACPPAKWLAKMSVVVSAARESTS